MSPTFTPVAGLAGGALIGLSAVLMMALVGRIAGVSGIAARLLPPWSGAGEALAFVVGLALAPIAWAAATGTLPRMTVAAGPGTLVVAGLLVGFGAVLGGGCTSGHGVCGMARGSRRSVAAVATFMATAVLTVLVARQWGAA